MLQHVPPITKCLYTPNKSEIYAYHCYLANTITVPHSLWYPGEACGQGSLCELQERIEEKGFSYVCYNIYGDVSDPSQTAALGQCANAIIAAEQQGMYVCSMVIL